MKYFYSRNNNSKLRYNLFTIHALNKIKKIETRVQMLNVVRLINLRRNVTLGHVGLTRFNNECVCV